MQKGQICTRPKQLVQCEAYRHFSKLPHITISQQIKNPYMFINKPNQGQTINSKMLTTMRKNQA